MKKIYIGPAGWSYIDWKGIVYPRLKKGQTELAYLARYFNTVEINSSFYRIPSEAHALSWIEQVRENPDFLFSIKLWQGFTHEDAAPNHESTQAFINVLDVLQDHGKLAALLIQFPYRFKQNAENLTYIESLADQFNTYSCCIEFRHNSWNTPAIHQRLRSSKVTWVNIDQPVIADSIAPGHVITTRLGYIRLHGRNYRHWFNEQSGRDDRYNYLYSAAELQQWVQTVTEIDEKCERTIVIFNNHFRGQAVVNSLQLSALLLQQPVLIPTLLTNLYPSLTGIARIANTGETLSLF